MKSFPKHCRCCRRDITAAQWAALHYVGEQVTRENVSSVRWVEERLELRNCECGTTLSIVK